MKKYFKQMKQLGKIGVLFLIAILFLTSSSSCSKNEFKNIWNDKFDFIYNIPPIVFHYYHGILSGSYPSKKETIEIHFEDVCKYLGHICLCGAGGYKISEIAINSLNNTDSFLERGEFLFITSKENTVSDVVAYILGCTRRESTERNQYFVDTTIQAPKREYHYYIGYPPERKAVHIIYRKHLLIGNQLMDSLWKIELAYEDNPHSVNQSEIEIYQNALYNMIKDVLFDKKKEAFEVEQIKYEDFLLMVEKFKK